MKLRKSGKTEMRPVEAPPKGAMMRAAGQIEGDLWEDLDGNVHAWTPKGSGVISIEIKEAGEEEMIKAHYDKLKKKEFVSQEERIAALEEALTAALKKIAELGG